MRDPDLVLRAQRAATALEQAWRSWRSTHGVSTDPLPPVSGYVGYSLDEPWGQPRVVFGICAEEAEHLAALLEGHDCIGPVHAAVVASPAAGSRVHVPAQAPADGARPGAPEYLTAKQALPPRSAASGQAAGPGAGGPADRAPAGPTPIEREASRAVLAAAAAREPAAVQLPAAALDSGQAGEPAGPPAAAADAAPPRTESPGEPAVIEPGQADQGTAVMAALTGSEDPPSTGQAQPPGPAPSSHVPRHADPAGADLADDEPPGAPAEPAEPAAAAQRPPYGYPQPGAPGDPVAGGEGDWPVAGPSEVVAFRPRPELAAYLDEGPEPDPFLDGPQERDSGDRGRASRGIRGAAMSRLGKSRRPSPDREPAGAADRGAAAAGRGTDGADHISASAVAADAAAWASSELPGQAAATDTAV
ncbi:MAG: hypothetical protein ACLP3Q_01895 [Streptosporangiaceae bacterium]